MTVIYEVLTLLMGEFFAENYRKGKKSDITWPLTQEELLSRIDTGPLPEIYNETYFSIYKPASINQYGHVTLSHIAATKICSLAGDWEGLITKQHTPKQIILGMVLHKKTGMNSFCFSLFPALLYP